MKNYIMTVKILYKAANDQDAIDQAKLVANTGAGIIPAAGYQDVAELSEIAVVELNDCIEPIREVAVIDSGC